MKKKRKTTTREGTFFKKYFVNPFVEPDYYKKISYAEFFKEVEKELEDYTVRALPCKHLKPIKDSIDEDELTQRLKVLVPYCPDLWESDHPTARLLVRHFGRLLNVALCGVDIKARQEAAFIIEDITKTKPFDFKNAKKYIPPLLSLHEMFRSVHRITEYLRKQYINECDKEPLSDLDVRDENGIKKLSGIDIRLVDLAKERRINILISQPKKLTKMFMADFFGLTLDGLNQAMKAEKTFLRIEQ